MTASDECIENCLNALASASYNHINNALYIYKYPKALKAISDLMRHPEKIIKMMVAKILSSINKF